MTGLSGAGKTTVATVLADVLRNKGHQVTVFDGDAVRAQLSNHLGFSKEDRDTNVKRVASLASEVVKQGGVALCALVSPYRETRSECRRIVGDRFVEVFVDAPLALCETRDVKGLYARARRGEIHRFTGIDDPYEAPTHPDVHLVTVDCSPESCCQRILDHLVQTGLA
jgi:adenylyl-sulfate kinase